MCHNVNCKKKNRFMCELKQKSTKQSCSFICALKLNVEKQFYLWFEDGLEETIKSRQVSQNHFGNLSSSDKGDSAKWILIGILSVCKSQLLNYLEELISKPMHFSAGGFGVLKLPLFQCSEPLGDLMHASPCIYLCTPGFYGWHAQLA